MSSTTFLHQLAHAPEELRREAKEEARRAIAELCFTEDDIRDPFSQEAEWDEMSDEKRQEAIDQLMDAWEFEPATEFARQSILEAIGRYIQDSYVEKYQQEDD